MRLFLLLLSSFMLEDPNSEARVVLEDLYRPETAKTDSRNRIYVTDSGNHQVLVYEPNGTLASRLGAAGNGPGEFNLPTDLAFLPDGRILVADSGNRRVHIFDAEGNFIRSIKISDQTVGRLLVPPEQGFILTKTGGRSFTIDDERKKQWRLYRYDLEGNRLGFFGSGLSHKNPLLNAWLNDGAVDMLGDKVVYAGRIVNELVVYTGKDEKRVTIPLTFIPREPDAKMTQKKMPNGSISFSMSMDADHVCAAMAVRSPSEVLLMRARSGPTGGDEPDSFELVAVNFDGKLLRTYPGKYFSPVMTLSAGKDQAYIIHETEEDWVLSKVSL